MVLVRTSLRTVRYVPSVHNSNRFITVNVDGFELNCPITHLIRVCVRAGTGDVDTALVVRRRRLMKLLSDIGCNLLAFIL